MLVPLEGYLEELPQVQCFSSWFALFIGSRAALRVKMNIGYPVMELKIMTKRIIASPPELTLDGSQFVLTAAGKRYVRTLVNAGFPEPTWQDMFEWQRRVDEWKAQGNAGLPPTTWWRCGYTPSPAPITLF